MLKTHIAACLMASALVAAPAFAQTSTAPASPSSSGTMMNQPASPAAPSGSSTMNAPAAGASAAAGSFIEMQKEGQVMASDLIGQNVVGPNGESIGEINDIIVDQSGRTVGAIIGVGGFLGIGEKDVAVAFDSLEMSRDTNTTASTTTAPGAAGTAGGTAANQTGVSATPTAGKPVVATDGKGDVERVVLNMTKDQLKAAPTFRRMDDRDTSNASAPATTAPGSTAPGAPARPATPN